MNYIFVRAGTYKITAVIEENNEVTTAEHTLYVGFVSEMNLMNEAIDGYFKDGLKITVFKVSGILIAEYKRYYNAPAERIMTIDVVTNVIQGGGPGTNNIARDENRSQNSGTQQNPKNTYPTQIANGLYEIIAADVPRVDDNNETNGFPYGRPGNGLCLGVIQQLPRIDSPPTLVSDTGYLIHITPLHYTNGCIGIPYGQDRGTKEETIAKMIKLVQYYEFVQQNGQIAYVEVKS